MRRLSPASFVPAVVVALAVYAWVASPQGDGVLERAADALEEAGTASIRAEAQSGPGEPFVTRFEVDFERGVVVIHDPEPGVARRVVTRRTVYDQLVDGTWLLLLDGAPPLFGQDVVEQLRGIDAVATEVGPGRYRLNYRQLGSEAEARLVLDDQGVPRRFTATYDVAGHEATLTWEVLRTGVAVEVGRPEGARPVRTEERAALVDAAA